jgi:hypothetical protein
VPEKQIATRMISDLIVNSPVCLTTAPADFRKYPAEHSRSAGRAAGVLKIDCLPNDPAPVFHKLASSGSECETKIAFPQKEKKDVARRARRAMFARIGTVTDFTAGTLREGAK